MDTGFINGLLDINKPQQEITGSQFFINFLNLLEGYKTKCKNLHWSAPKKNIHVYLDDFLDILVDYQDGLAEGFMGVLGKIAPNAIKATPNECLNAMDFIEDIRTNTINFYDKIPKESIYSGIRSDCEVLIQNINKYHFLFSLCDIKPY